MYSHRPTEQWVSLRTTCSCWVQASMGVLTYRATSFTTESHADVECKPLWIPQTYRAMSFTTESHAAVECKPLWTMAWRHDNDIHLRPFSRWTWVSRYQNVSILDFTGAKDNGGGSNNWIYKMCKALVKSPPPTNQHPTFYRPDALHVAQPTVSKHWRGKSIKFHRFAHPKLTWGSSNLFFDH